jgi:hypothetical protein
MRVPLYCEDESLTPWKSAKGEQHNPLTLLFRDAATEGKLRELVELRIEDEVEKAKVAGKCKDKVVIVEIHRFGKFNGIARLEGCVHEIKGVPPK